MTGLLRLRVGSEEERRRRLPRRSRVTLGRGRQNGLEVRDPRLPRTLASFDPTGDGWVMRNGERARVRVRSPLWITDPDGARFGQSARILLHEGIWRLDWDELDVPCHVDVDVHPVRHGEHLPPYVLDSGVDDANAFVGTDLAADRMRPDAATRHQLALIFRHLILEESAPVNLYEAAAKALGRDDGTNAVRNLVNRHRQRLNRERSQDLETTEQLGHYLVRVAGTLTVDDLDP